MIDVDLTRGFVKISRPSSAGAAGTQFSAGTVLVDAARLALILRAWRTARPDKIATYIDASPDAARLCALARQHRLGGLLHRILPDPAPTVAAALRADWHRNLAGHLQRAAVFDRVWPHSAPPPLVFKGADVAESLFADPGARASSDLDLLLPDPHFDEVAKHLGARADVILRPVFVRRCGDIPHELGFSFDSIVIELHREPQPAHRGRLRGRSIWQRGTPARLGAHLTRRPSPIDRVLLWLVGAVNQAFALDLADWLDLALLLDHLPRSNRWSRLRAATTASGLRRPWILACHRLAATGLWPSTLPANGALTAGAVDRWLLPHALSPPTAPDRIRGRIAKWWLLDRSARRAVLVRALAQSHDSGT